MSEIYEAAVSGDAVVIYGDDENMWVSTDLADWRRPRRPPGMFMADGPGGLIAFGGGGPDSIRPTTLWRSSDGSAWERVKLPKAARRPNDGVGVFGLDDGWVLVSDQPGPIFTSPDGIRWRRSPRPPGMTHGARWITSMGDRVQAHGAHRER